MLWGCRMVKPSGAAFIHGGRYGGMLVKHSGRSSQTVAYVAAHSAFCVRGDLFHICPGSGASYPPQPHTMTADGGFDWRPLEGAVPIVQRDRTKGVGIVLFGQSV